MELNHLIATVRGLTALSLRKPAQVNLRRAHSTAYYAVFHFLTRTAVNEFVGKGRNRSAAWHRVYHVLEHGNAKAACLNNAAMQEFSAAIRNFADMFVAPQAERCQADYALKDRYFKQRKLAAIEKAGNAIKSLKQVSLDFVACILFKWRL